MKTLGICFGATSMQCVILHADDGIKTVVRTGRINHEGNPQKAFLDFLSASDIYDIDRIAVTGRGFRNAVPLSSISEPEAVELALQETFSGKHFPDSVVSCGGETQLVYAIGESGSVLSVHSGNKCASGTGEFFLQQIRRMGLDLPEAISLASEGTPYAIAGRCSVFCKSDCTHALNKGEPVENIVSGLCVMMADKIGEIIKDMACNTLAVIGGGVLNKAFVDILRKRYPKVLIPEQGTVFEAYGAALWAAENTCRALPPALRECVSDTALPLACHPPLRQFREMVVFKESQREKVRGQGEYIVGVDVGSTTTKAVLVSRDASAICADIYLRTNGDPVRAAKQCYAAILDQVGAAPISIIGLGVTGSGRQIAGLHALTDNVINEIIAHATAAAYHDPEVDTIFEIGGQDAKYTSLTGGVASDYAMNEACSAGTGSFLEESASETLGVRTQDIGDRAFMASHPPNFSDQCAAFISSDIKRAIQHGVSKNDILAGLVYSICMNYANRVKGNRATGRKIFMQGGVCYNKAVPVAMAALLKKEIVVPPDPGLMGAFGVALETARRIELGLSEVKRYDLRELARRDAVRESTFICRGGREKCDRKCEIARVRINDQLYPFGGICNKYYTIRLKKEVKEDDSLDYVALRQRLLFEVFGPDAQMPADRGSIGINRSLLTYSLYPLYAHFFTNLKFKVVLPDQSDVRGIQRAEAAFCLPVEYTHGSFFSLLKKKCDCIFLPQIIELQVPAVPTHSKLCPFVQGETYYLATTFRKEIEESGSKIIRPVINMKQGYEKAADAFIEVASQLGVGAPEARRAFTKACERQRAFEKELQARGREALARLEKNPKMAGIVVFGRPYNAFARDGNMGIPHKIASRNYLTIPHDMLPADAYPVDAKMFWAMGQKIMKAAQFVQEHTQLFGFYITNFSCGPDSFLLGYFRTAMGSKPSLTLELDQHTADAGIDTRIEAALDIIARYRKIKDTVCKDTATTAAARVHYPYVYSSAGKRLSITDPEVEVLIPSFGNFASEAVAALLRRKKINARALPVLDKDGFLLGKNNTSGKECLPYIVTTGAFLQHLEKKDNPDTVSLFMMATGGGPCRLGQYFRALEQLIHRKKIPNAAVLTISDENGYGGLGLYILLKAWQAIILADVLQDIHSMLQVSAADTAYAMKLYNECLQQCIAYFEGKLSIRFSALLRFISLQLRLIPLRRDPETVPVISLVGEIYVRRDEFSRKNIIDYFENRGFMVRVAPLTEYICYSKYVINRKLGEHTFTLSERMKIQFATKVEEWWEKKIKSILSTSGVYRYELIDVAKTIKGVKHLLHEKCRGECILTVGLGMREILNDSCGVVSIGPFGCMYSRMAEAMLKKEMNSDGKRRMPDWEDKIADFEAVKTFPFISIETDGNPFPQIVEANLEAFVLQARRLHAVMMRREAKAFRSLLQKRETEMSVEK